MELITKSLVDLTIVTQTCKQEYALVGLIVILVILGGVESNSGIFSGSQSFLFTFRGVMMKLT